MQIKKNFVPLHPLSSRKQSSLEDCGMFVQAERREIYFYPEAQPNIAQISKKFAEIAQLVEHDLAKVGVASSSLVFRSKSTSALLGCFFREKRLAPSSFFEKLFRHERWFLRLRGGLICAYKGQFLLVV